MTSNQKFLKGKRILITSYSYAMFGGAELNAVELAEQLIKFGAKVDFFSYDIEGPLAEFINKKFNTTVIVDSVNKLAEDDSEKELKNIRFNISDYDYIWVGGNTIPLSIIKQINTAKKLPKFIFVHMSPLIAFPLDAPLMPEFEKKIASRILSISEHTTNECIYRILGKNIPLGKWHNPVPEEFRFLEKRRGELRKIAVISSSYPTDEVMVIKTEIEKQGMEIDYIGKYNDNVKVVDASFYDKYDLIIGVGKNVKYSLVSGVPVYVYGRFNGPGYLNKKNYSLNEKMNFSGRGFDKKTSSQIINEIIKGYDKALEYHEKNREKFIQEFSIDIVAENLFKELENEKPKRVNFSDEYINWLVSMQLCLMKARKAAGSSRRKADRMDILKEKLNIFKTKIAQRDVQIAQLKTELDSHLNIKRSARLLVGNIKRKIKQG